MKKSLLALAAMSAFAGAAQAQSSVSVYGIIDAGFLSTNATNGGANANGTAAVAATATDHDGDRNVILVRPESGDWIVAFIAKQNGVVCTLNSGTDFKVTPMGRS
jgi:hypothetical protein